METENPGLLDQIIEVARSAGAAIMEIYATDFGVEKKIDASPVTVADEKAEIIILKALAAMTPDIPVVSEEAASDGRIPDIGKHFWLVDPLDGTQEFISRNGEFTVNIALIENGQPVLGVVFAPALNRLFAGLVGEGAFIDDNSGRHAIGCRQAPADGLTVVSSRSHGDAAALNTLLTGRKVAASLKAGSSLKLCLIAAGEADMYPRLGRTMEWDIAAGHAVLRAAGGCVKTLAGDELRYGKDGLDNPHFIASGAA